MKNRYLLIETSTEACSVAIAEQDTILSERYVQEFKVHASKLAPFIKEVLNESGTELSQCSAVAVSGGPGSYTGLRVGVSTAKGLCFGASLPLISVGTLNILAHMVSDNKNLSSNSIIVPMVDARRMEVYTALFDNNGEQMSQVEALILDENSFATEFDRYDSVTFIGDGCAKFETLLGENKSSKAIFIPAYPKASAMIHPVLEAFKRKRFEDCAYFEPFYLKEFVAGISKKTLI